MISKHIQNELEQAVLCWLATSSNDGTPNVSPKELFCCLNATTIVVANIASPNTVKNIQVNPKVCLSLVDVFTQRGFQFKGMAKLIRERSKCPDAFLALEALAGPRFPIHSLLWIDVKHIKPILAPSYVMYPDTKQEEMVKQAMDRYGVRPKKH